MLALIMALGFGLRMDKVINPLADPGDDAFAYRALAESLYEEGSYGGPGFDTPSDWSPGAPLLYAGAYYVTGGVRDGVGRGVQALLGTAAILIVYLLTLRLSPRRSAALIAAGHGRRLPAVHPLHRGADERTTGPVHPSGGRTGTALGRLAWLCLGLAAARAAVRADRADPARVPVRGFRIHRLRA